MQFKRLTLGLATLGVAAASPLATAEEIEILHLWTSGGESRAVNVLKQNVEKQGHVWKDFAVAGGGGAAAMTVLKTRVIAGTPPGAAWQRGPSIQEWAEQGALVELDSVAKDWDKVLAPAVSKVEQYQGHYVAAPHWVHRVNWMWINKAALDKVGGKPPTTWPEFFALADKLKAAGYIPIAHGETAYQDRVLFESVALSMGKDFYRKAVIELDPATLNSPKMAEVFDIMRKMQAYHDPGVQGRSWNLAAAMVIEGKAAILFMGDWAKGEFSSAKKEANKDYVCIPTPGTDGSYAFIADSFAFFKQRNQKGPTKGQQDLAAMIMSPAYQEQAALYKGAIPARSDASLANFDDCAKKSAADLQAAIKTDSLVPGVGQGASEAAVGAIHDVTSKFMTSGQDSKAAAAALASAVKATK